MKHNEVKDDSLMKGIGTRNELPAQGKHKRTTPASFEDFVHIEYNFLMLEDVQALFERCRKLPFCRQLTVPWGKPKRHQTVTFSEKYSPRLGYVGPHFTLEQAPPEIQALAAKLSAHTGKNINYLSVVLYEDGADYMNWHQHAEDKGYDASVCIVSTGATRPFGVRLVAEPTAENDRKTKRVGTYLDAEPGSLITLSSAANDKCEHSVPKAAHCSAPRIAINCKSVGPRVYSCRKADESPKGAVYVGREVRDRQTGTVVFPDTPFGNHYRLPPDQFRAYAEELMRDEEFAAQVEGLRGRDLLCWCAGKKREHCHARVWLELANRRN